MFKKILKKTLIFSLPVLSFSAVSGQNKEFLANQCSTLSHVVFSLANSQVKKSCVDKLNTASGQMDTAALLIMQDSAETAKQNLNNAVSALHYAELLACNQYIQISHSKLEVHKIKTLLS